MMSSDFTTKIATEIPQKSTLRVLHTADWHIGKRLYHQNRHAEHQAFLVWLYEAICQHEVDILIVAGDIFDTMTPSNQAQALYYDFLAKMAKSPCQHIVIIGGNHDSPTLLDAPRHILKSLSIHITGVISEDITEDCLVLRGEDGTPQAIVLAVPFLRDKDIKTSTHLSPNDDNTTLNGIARHYQTLTEHAKRLQAEILATTGQKIPLIATGHLFCAGASVSSKDDGMREIHVGTLGQIPASIFDPSLDYVALGHIHAPQKVSGCAHIRYSGSPLALGFGEIAKTKYVLMVDFAHNLQIHKLPTPTFQKLAHIEGDLAEIFHELDDLVKTKQSIWVQIVYTGNTLEPNLNQKIKEHLDNTQVIALYIQNKSLYQNSLHSPTLERLDKLSPSDVFAHRLAKEQLSDDDISALKSHYESVLYALYDEPSHEL